MKNSSLYTDLTLYIENFFESHYHIPVPYNKYVLLEYLLSKGNIPFNLSDDLYSQEDLLKKIQETLWLFKNKKNNNSVRKLTEIGNIQDHSWHPLLVRLKKNIIFFVNNEEELNYLYPVLVSLNRFVVLFCNFTLPQDFFPSFVLVIEVDFSDQKVYENINLENEFNELYNYVNTFTVLFNIIQPQAVVVLGNTGFQEKVLSSVAHDKEIPVIALRYGNNNDIDSILPLLPYNYYIPLLISDKSEKELKLQLASQICRLINNYSSFPYFDDVDEYRLQIGCGLYPLEGWLNTDLNFNEEISYMNAEHPFPFREACFDYVFSEHLFEHLTYGGGKNMLRETYRVLKPGGIFRLTMPDFNFLIQLYQDRDNELHQKYIEWSSLSFFSWIKEDFGSDKVTPALIINLFMRGFNHKVIYDKETITYLLKKTGFKNIVYPQVGESNHPLFKGIEQHASAIPEWANMLETFVVEAQK